MKKANSKTSRCPMNKIDTSDIPEVTDCTGALRRLFARPETWHISIRLSAEDLLTANRLAAGSH